ncbi:hypothetical protein LEMLEM_LOCUS13983, partial [Lemmus lemmus]
ELRPRACWALNSCITKTSWDLDGYSCSLNPTCSNKPGRPQMADGGYWTLRLRICLEGRSTHMHAHTHKWTDRWIDGWTDTAESLSPCVARAVLRWRLGLPSSPGPESLWTYIFASLLQALLEAGGRQTEREREHRALSAIQASPQQSCIPALAGTQASTLSHGVAPLQENDFFLLSHGPLCPGDPGSSGSQQG